MQHQKLILIFAIFLAFCLPSLGQQAPPWQNPTGQKPQTAPAQTQPEQLTTIEGIIYKASPSVFMQGTHELRNDKGELVARLTMPADAGSTNMFKFFEEAKVQLTGKWVPSVEAGGQVFEVITIDRKP